MRIAVIGLGLMGGTIAGHLLSDGHDVPGYDPDIEATEAHARRGGIAHSTVGAAVEDVQAVVLSLPNGAVTRQVASQIATTGRAGMLVADTTTGEPEDAIAAAATLHESGIEFVDATISGNSAQAAVRDVIFMIGGDEAAFVRATVFLSPLGRAVHHVGPVGAGAAAKLIVNHVLSINRTAVAEGLAVAEKAGIDLDAMLTLLVDSAAYSRAMDIWGRRMVAADHDPPASRVRQSHKDSRLINAFASRLGASHELVEAVRRALVEAEAGGLGDADNSSIMEVMRRRAGIGRFPEG